MKKDFNDDLMKAYHSSFIDTLSFLGVPEPLKGKARAFFVERLTEYLSESFKSSEVRKSFLKITKGLIGQVYGRKGKREN